MKANEIIETAEKYRLLGRFDRTSAIGYLNDAIFDIVHRQGLSKEYTVSNYNGSRIEIPTDVVIEITGVYIEKASEYDNVKYLINPDCTIDIYHVVDIEKGYQIATQASYPELTDIKIDYLGYTAVTLLDDDVPLSVKYKTALMYYVRSKMLEESDNFEKSTFFEQKYLTELLKRIQPYKEPITRPGDYSLL